MNETVNQPPIQNKYSEYFMKNKSMTLLFGLGFVLIIIIISIGFILASGGTSTVNKTTNIDLTPHPSSSTIIVPTIASDNTQEETIKTDAKPQLDKLIEVDYIISKVKTYGDTWAMVEVNNPTTDPANVVLKKENGSWKVMMGPGTQFDAQELIDIGAPQSLINESNTSF
jgi:hypothetical protein